MKYFLYTLLIIILLIILVIDFKYRKIHSISLFFLVTILTISSYFESSALVIIKNTESNFVFLLTLYLFLCLYFSLRERKLNFNLSDKIGVGDILFFICLIPYFNLLWFILIFNLGCIVSLVIFLFLSSYQKSRNIPLAGLFSLFLVIVFILNTTLYRIDLHIISNLELIINKRSTIKDL